MLWVRLLKNKKLLSKFIEKINNPERISIALPESNSRIYDAIKVLREIGLNILTSDDINSSNVDPLPMLKNLKFSKNWEENDLIKYSSTPFIKSLLMLRENKVSGIVCGSEMKSAEVIRGSLRIIGLKNTVKNLSSMFLMINESSDYFITFSDCAVIPEPNSEQLSEIAYQAGSMHRELVGEEERIAFLSFSTKGSADHYRVKNIQKAVDIFGRKYPDMQFEGEIQVDAALDSVVAENKIKDSTLKGNANTLIFPNLDAGNIGYKLVQRLASYYACGPLLLGLDKPVNDLSRGASVDDIILIVLLTAIQAEGCIDANI